MQVRLEAVALHTLIPDAAWADGWVVVRVFVKYAIDDRFNRADFGLAIEIDGTNHVATPKTIDHLIAYTGELPARRPESTPSGSTTSTGGAIVSAALAVVTLGLLRLDMSRRRSRGPSWETLWADAPKAMAIYQAIDGCASVWLDGETCNAVALVSMDRWSRATARLAVTTDVHSNPVGRRSSDRVMVGVSTTRHSKACGTPRQCVSALKRWTPVPSIGPRTARQWYIPENRGRRPFQPGVNGPLPQSDHGSVIFERLAGVGGKGSRGCSEEQRGTDEHRFLRTDAAVLDDEHVAAFGLLE